MLEADEGEGKGVVKLRADEGFVDSEPQPLRPGSTNRGNGREVSRGFADGRREVGGEVKASRRGREAKVGV